MSSRENFFLWVIKWTNIGSAMRTTSQNWRKSQVFFVFGLQQAQVLSAVSVKSPPVIIKGATESSVRRCAIYTTQEEQVENLLLRSKRHAKILEFLTNEKVTKRQSSPSDIEKLAQFLSHQISHYLTMFSLSATHKIMFPCNTVLQVELIRSAKIILKRKISPMLFRLFSSLGTLCLVQIHY